MTQSNKPISVRTWRRESGHEPVVRVGVVLEEDAYSSVDLTIPPGDYELVGAGRSIRMSGWRGIAARLVGETVTVQPAHGEESVASSWRLSPTSPRRMERGAGVLVRDVVAGRGFHWQKRMDQTFPGTLELRPARGGLVLVNELPLEEYLAGVITAEMGGACPPDLLRSQCVVARSWLLAMTEAKHEHEPFDRCNDDCCQRYQGTGDMTSAALDAVTATRGCALVTADGTVVDANYSKSCGGVSELPEHIWGAPKPGLSAVADMAADSPGRRFCPVREQDLDEYLDEDWWTGADVYCSPDVVPEELFGKYLGRVDEGGTYFRWTATLERPELEELLRKKLPEARELRRFCDLRVVSRGVSGRASELEVDFEDANGDDQTVRVRSEYRIREALHPKFLYSSAFVVRIDRDAAGMPSTITLRGGGWGHGAGLCQIGALGMALKGIGYERTLRHYFPDANLTRVYD